MMLMTAVVRDEFVKLIDLRWRDLPSDRIPATLWAKDVDGSVQEHETLVLKRMWVLLQPRVPFRTRSSLPSGLMEHSVYEKANWQQLRRRSTRTLEIVAEPLDE